MRGSRREDLNNTTNRSQLQLPQSSYWYVTKDFLSQSFKISPTLNNEAKKVQGNDSSKRGRIYQFHKIRIPSLRKRPRVYVIWNIKAHKTGILKTIRYNNIMQQTQQDDKIIRIDIKIKQLYSKYPILKYPF